jgi:hypothetical protein
MADDPRRGIVEVMARLGRATQYHIDERYRHFQITDLVIYVTSALLVILAVFNIYYIRTLYNDLTGIVTNMDSMHERLKVTEQDMSTVAGQMAAIDQKMQHMDPIHGHMASLAKTMPHIRVDMHDIAADVGTIEREMGVLGQGMVVIDGRTREMLVPVSTMRENVRQFGGPMGAMNPFMP